MHSLVFILAVAYLLGSIPFGLLLVFLFRGEDVRTQGSGNIGATNVLRSGSKPLAIATLLFDIGKGVTAVLLAAFLSHGQSDAMVLAALMAILGHIFPVWLGFRGGKGVATAFGAFVALAPWAALAAVGIFAAIVFLTRYVSLASILAAAAFPFLALLLYSGSQTVVFRIVIFCCAALVILRHQKNIVRLAKGAEYRFGRMGPRQA